MGIFEVSVVAQVILISPEVVLDLRIGALEAQAISLLVVVPEAVGLVQDLHLPQE